MADQHQVSIKQIKIDKANKAMMVTIGIASFVVVFALVASKSLLSYYSYQNRVISAKKQAVSQLKSDIGSVSDLVSSYKAFVGTPQNILGGSTTGNGQNDGDNATIILDALPSTYDFPGLTSSIQNLFAGQPYTITSISGTDQELTQTTGSSGLSSTPVQIPMQITATGSYKSIQSFIDRLQLSTRPFQVQTLGLSGNDNNLTASVSTVTYYQPGVSFQISKENVQ